jgi:HSP20 family molecular chaperone IbpA
MVLGSIFTHDPIFNALFFGVTQESKPPCEFLPIYEENSTQIKGCQICFALAGFRKEDIRVWSKKKTLYITGDNTKEGSPVFGSKFACSFKREFNVADKLDLTHLEVSFENGLLKIIIPMRDEVETDKIIHFGN